MKDQRIAWLAGLLIVQLLVVAALLIGRGGFSEPETGPLLAFDTAAIDGMVIEEGKDKSITLARKEGRWFLAGPAAVDGSSAGDVPADPEKVEKLINKLAGLRAPWPVATTASARERFEVGDANSQRHVLLQTGGKTAAELLAGTSPGFRRLHVRIPGADAVYEVDLTHLEMSTAADEWVDRAVLAATGNITAVAREGRWRLARSDEGWMLDDGAADSNAAEQMAERFANLRVLGVAAPAAGGDSTEPAAVFAVTDDKGPYRVSLYGAPDSTKYVITSDRQPGRFRLASFVAEQLQVEGATLLPGTNPPAGSGEGDEAVPAAAPAPGAAPSPKAGAARATPAGGT